MVGDVLLVVIGYGVIAAMFFFMATYSARGRCGKWDYDRLPGIMTPNTLHTRETWIAAHRPLRRYFAALGWLYIVCGCGVAWHTIAHGALSDSLFMLTYLGGLLPFVVLIVVGDRLASRAKRISKMRD